PSVLAERNDIPEALGRVVARALEKRPEDRYQTVNELVEDFTIAAGMELPSVSASGSNPRVGAPAADQIADEADEETLVRSRVTRPMPTPESVVELPHVVPAAVTALPYDMPPPAAAFNPWKVLVPSLIGLIVIFGVIYALSRNSQPSGTTTTGSTLAADPNSSPVEPATPPTGESEAGIPAGGTTNQAANTNANANTSASPLAADTPTDVNELDANTNENTNENSNRKKTTLPLPSPTAPVEVAPPPPSPAATKPPLPKPTQAEPSGSPPGIQVPGSTSEAL
ncbi:MAG TPA: hypothetical protein VK208_20195, partial [Pyrinomonadaceae bacterium]|nr:hypothetical protein [Pyrinomonadaceae bacterium]